MGHGGWQELVEQLGGAPYRSGSLAPDASAHRVEFDPGLTDAEVVAAESRFGFRFPPDLREFLQAALPKGAQFPDWRSRDEGGIRDWLDLPLRGVLFDIESDGFWPEEWGPPPGAVGEALRRGDELVSAAPRLIPVYAHRMMPSEPHLPGNPVFSVHQTDIIHYGFDLADSRPHSSGSMRRYARSPASRSGACGCRGGRRPQNRF